MCKNCVQKYAIFFWHFTDKVPAGHKDLSNQPGYKEQLVVVCVRVRESAAARVIEIDENWLWQIA